MIVLCSVCFNGAESAMRESLNAGIFVLLGVTGLELAAVGAFLVQIARRSRALEGLAGGEPLLTETLDPGSVAGALRG
jgi:hypothetical protein